MTALWLDERAQPEREYSQVSSCLAISKAVYANTVEQCVDLLNNDLNNLNHGISNVVYPRTVGLPIAIAYKSVHNEVYIAFRGTDSLESLFPSLDIRGMGNSFQGRCHYGYLQEAQKYPLTTFLELLDNHPGLHMILTGHSLGGAVASIVTAYLLSNASSNDIVSRIRCVAFGAPNMCDRRCAEYLNIHFPDHFDFYINHRDIVPFVFTFVSDFHVANRLPLTRGFSSLTALMMRLSSRIMYQVIFPRYQSFGNTFQTDPTQSHINRVDAEQLVAEVFAEMTNHSRISNVLREGVNDHKIENYIRQIYDYTIFRHRLVTPFSDQFSARVGGCSILDPFIVSAETCVLL